MTSLSGHCLCQKVHYHITAPPLESTHCHCKMCQRQHGAAFATYVRVQSKDLEVLEGQEHLKAYRSSEQVDRIFCQHCGSSLFFDYLPLPEIRFVTAGTLDEPEGIHPTRHIFVASQAPWHDGHAVLPRYQHYPATITVSKDDALNLHLEALVHGVQNALQANLMGVYLQGSFAIGDFDQDSDIDFIVLTRAPMTESEIELLQGLHPQIFARGGRAQYFEGSYFPLDMLQAPPDQSPVWYLDNGAQQLEKSDHCNTYVVRHTLQSAGITLCGPKIQTLLEPVPTDTLKAEIYSVMHDWGEQILAQPDAYNNRFYQGFILLNYCRMYHDWLHGTVSSKKTGATWVQTHLAPKWHGLIERAWSCRPSPEIQVRKPADPEDYKATLEFLRFVLEDTHTKKEKSPT